MIGLELRCGQCEELTTVRARLIDTVKRKEPRDFQKQIQREYVLKQGGACEAVWFGICDHCGQPIMAITLEQQDKFLKLLKSLNKPNEPTLLYRGQRIIEAFPAIPQPKQIPSIPPKVDRSYSNLWKAQRAGLTADAVISLARICLESICSSCDINKAKLIHMIDELLAKGLITRHIADWAHNLRSLGNKAIHETEAKEDDVNEVIAFIELLLDVLFALPAKIAEATAGSD